ncbi:MAG: hypothetical protein KGL95_12320, partial [Patescibacteria group bacterium]|nr:hypothetical protein [Patescibacteria group bacterium]
QGTLLIGNASNGYSVATLTPGSGISITNGSGSITIADTQTSWFTQNLGLLYPINSTLDFALGGTATTSSKFAVINVNSGTPVASISANNGNNSTYISGNGILATTNKQNLTLGDTTTTGQILLSNLTTANAGLNIPSGQNLTLSGITSANQVLYSTKTSGIVAGVTTSTPNLCLLSGTTTPAWGTCALGTNYFQLNSNVISPYNTTLDLAVGGNSTSSALFQIFGATGNASTSGTLTFNNVPGVIQTTASQNLTIGGNTTGQIFLSGLNGTNGGVNLQGYGTGALLSSSNGNITSGKIPLNDTSYVSGTLGIGNGGTGTNSTPSQGTLLIGNASNGYSVATLTPGSGISITNGSGSITIADTQTSW